MMENILKVLEKLEQQKYSNIPDYNIPECWNYFGYKEFKKSKTRPGEIVVNPYKFYSESIKENILRIAEVGSVYLPALDSNNEHGIDISSKTIYSMLPRALTAWEHTVKGEIQPGTFVKALCYLPFLRKLGVDIIYLLPVFELSNVCKKGEKASPYAIKNIYRLDPDLHEPLTGDDASFIDIEFKAFVEACHILGMRVILDFVFRTCSRDNDLLIEHPEWFYWIDIDKNETFKAPELDLDEQLVLINDKYLKMLYKSPSLIEYKSSFSFPPNIIDSKRWNAVVERYKSTGENILQLVEAEFNITTMPGFSNVLNDPQPQWKDATYPKFYFDHDPKVQKYINADEPEFLMQDGISLNLYHGVEKNIDMWSYIGGVIPFYQQNFGIDGARIDMAHALPVQLNKSIIAKTKENNKHFLLWSEEFSVHKSEQAKKDGFHFISGFLYGQYKEVQEEGFNIKLFEETLLPSKLPIAAAMETPDTPRAAYIHDNKQILEILTFINGFIPNKVLFINNGQELLEYQPMNLGLDNTEEGKFILNEDHSLYGKLAFFDNYYFDWTSNQKTWIQDTIRTVSLLNKEYSSLISHKENFYLPQAYLRGKLTAMTYYNGSIALLVIINRSLEDEYPVKINNLLPEELVAKFHKIEVKFSNKNRSNIDTFDNLICLKAGEIIIAEVR